MHDFADDVSGALRDIKAMAGEDAILRWAGRTAKASQDEFEDVPKNLKKLQRSYDLAGDALAAYWPRLERAQSLADRALAKGREARNELEEASDAGIQNRKWWAKAVDWVKDNWDTIVNVCKVIVAVVCIVVLITGGPLAWVVLAAALVVRADTPTSTWTAGPVSGTSPSRLS